MGTRAVYGFKKDNKYKVTYTNWDGGLEDLGKKIVEFINTTMIEEMDYIFNRIILVDKLDNPTKKQINECKKYADLNIATRTLKDFTCLLANSKGNLTAYRDENLKYMIDGYEYIKNVDFTYIIDLDNKKLKIYYCEIFVKEYNFNSISKKWIDECYSKI